MGLELRDLRVFLVLAVECHFGRTAERLGVTPSRVSQTVRGLERDIGGPLFHRTSRAVRLTSMGERFLAELEPAYTQLMAVVECARADNRRLARVLRLGVVPPMAGGPHMTTILETFEARHPNWEVRVSEPPLGEVLEPLRRGELDILAIPLPIEEPDLVVGPIMSREPRVLAVASDHPLARQADVSIEDVADYAVQPLAASPRGMMDELVPRVTPSGRPIRRLARRPGSAYEVSLLVARGRIVQPTVPSAAIFVGRANIVLVPIRDMRPSRSALVWRRGTTDPPLHAFVRTTRDVLRTAPDRSVLGSEPDIA
jgi:DNA-binding transcriptional LysR family regulator